MDPAASPQQIRRRGYLLAFVATGAASHISRIAPGGSAAAGPWLLLPEEVLANKDSRIADLLLPAATHKNPGKDKDKDKFGLICSLRIL